MKSKKLVPAKKKVVKKTPVKVKVTEISKHDLIDLIRNIYSSPDKKRFISCAKNEKIDGEELCNQLSDSEFERELSHFINEYFERNSFDEVEFEHIKVID